MKISEDFYRRSQKEILRRSSLHRVDDELHNFGVDSEKIFIRLKEDFHVRSLEIWVLGKNKIFN